LVLGKKFEKNAVGKRKKPYFAHTKTNPFEIMPPKSKFCRESKVHMTEMVLPNDTNPLNNLMGGRLLHLMDVAGAIAAQKHCNRVVVTASVDNVSFEHCIRLGSVVTLHAYVTRAFNSSMEVYVEVIGEEILGNGAKTITNKAYLTFVAVDQLGKPIPVPEALPETDEERFHYEGALRRRQLRLVLAGRMKPEEATELKSIFFTT
jgi:acyl-CoA hydrolase